MKILFWIFTAIIIWLLIGYIIRLTITKRYIRFIPSDWYLEVKNSTTIIIHHNGLRESDCIDEGDRRIDFHNEFIVGRLIIILLKIF